MKLSQTDNRKISNKLKNLSIADLLDISALQKLQDAFAKAIGAAVTLTDIDGNPITRPSFHCRVCTMIRETEKGLENCIRSGKILGSISINTNDPNFHKCHSIGFVDAAAPIVVEGVHLANWLMGQSCIGDVDEKRVVAYAEEIGVEKDALVEAFHEITPIPEQEFKEKVYFLWIMASQISSLAYEKYNLYQAHEKIRKSRDELNIYKNNLEKLVEERTQLLNKRNEQLRKEIKTRRANEKALVVSEERFRSIFEKSKDAIVSIHLDGSLKMLNPAGIRFFGLSDGEMELVKFNELFVDQGMARKFTTTLFKNGFVRDFGIQLKGANAGTMDCIMTLTVKTSSDGTIIGYEGIIRDVTPYKKMEEDLRILATTDSLTGINNRRNFIDLAQSEITRSARYGSKLSLLMLDIDHFKKINDGFGHSAGDRILCEFCDLCLKEIRDSDYIGRLGGEEFAIACVECDAATAGVVAERIRNSIELYKATINRKEIRFTVSIGVSEFHPDDTFHTLLHRADSALYEAKKSGRNQVVVN